MNITCTGCQGILVVSEELTGKSVRCGKCGTILRVETPAKEDATTAIKDGALVGTSGAASKSSASEEKAEPKRKSRDYDDDDDDLPTRRRRPWPGARPYRQGSGGRSTLVIVLIMLAVLVALIPCIGAGVLVVAGIAEERDMIEAEMQAEAEMEAELRKAELERQQAWQEDFQFKNMPQDANQDQLNAPLNEAEKMKLDAAFANIGPNDQEGPLAPKSPLWAKVARDVERDNLRKSPLVEGNRGIIPFAELAPQKGILVGFFVSAAQDQLFLIHYLQPIYLTPDGEKVGQRYGTPTGPVICIKAKAGYAVGAIHVRSGDLFDGFSMTFMKVRGDRLDADDSYDSDHFGGHGGKLLRINSEGRLIVGIHGRRLPQRDLTPAGSVTSLGLISLP